MWKNLRGVNGISSGTKFVASLLHAVAEGLLGFLEVAAGIVALLVADFAVNFEHAFDVLRHVSHDGTGEGILGVGVDIHLHHAIVESLLEVAGRGSGSTVEDEVHFSFGAILVGDDFLSVAEDGGLELDRAGLVSAVHVSEGRGKHEAPDRLEGFVDLHHVLGSGVQFLGGEAGGVVTVFFSTDATGFDFEDDVELDAFFEEFGGDLHVLIEIDNRSVEHVGLEKRAFSFFLALAGSVEERSEEGVDFLGMAVVGVKSDEDIVFLSENVDGFSKHDGSEGRVVNCGAGSELAATGGNLDNAIGLGLGECLERTICGGERGDVNGWVCVTTLLGGIEHLTVLFWCRDGHDWRWVTEISDIGKDWLYTGKI